MQDNQNDQTSLAIQAVYDPDTESVGVEAIASPAFEEPGATRARIEILAAVTARANCIAAQVIQQWDADDDRKKALFDHYAELKEHMLNDMLESLDRAD